MLDSALDRSAVAKRVGGLRDWLRARGEHSAVVHACRRVSSSGLDRAVAGTRLATLCSASTKFRQAGKRSRVVALSRLGRTSLVSSAAYRWFTAEPEPEVIVIDLRETRTIGPVIRGLDRVVSGFERWGRTSTVVDWCRQVGSTVQARPIRLASVVVLSAMAVSLLVASRGSPSTLFVYSSLTLVGLAALGLRSRASLGELLETRVGRAIVAAFEPPEPPERGEGEGDSR